MYKQRTIQQNKQDPTIVDYIQFKTDFPAEYVLYAIIIALPLATFDSLMIPAMTFVSIVFPLYWTIRSLFNYEKDEDKKWLTYWTVKFNLLLLDYFFSHKLKNVPYFYLFELLFLVWMFLPGLDGAVIVYDKIVRRVVNRLPVERIKLLWQRIQIKLTILKNKIIKLLRILPSKVHQIEDKVIDVSKKVANSIVHNPVADKIKEKVGEGAENIKTSIENFANDVMEIPEEATELIDQSIPKLTDTTGKERAISWEKPESINPFDREEKLYSKERSSGTMDKDERMLNLTKKSDQNPNTTQPKAEPHLTQEGFYKLSPSSKENKSINYQMKSNEKDLQASYTLKSEERITTPHSDKLINHKDTIPGEVEVDYAVQSKERIITPHSDKIISQKEKIETVIEAEGLNQKLNPVEHTKKQKEKPKSTQ